MNIIQAVREVIQAVKEKNEYDAHESVAYENKRKQLEHEKRIKSYLDSVFMTLIDTADKSQQTDSPISCFHLYIDPQIKQFIGPAASELSCEVKPLSIEDNTYTFKVLEVKL